MQKSTTQISPNIFKITLAPNPHFEFSSFLLTDDKPCLIHAGKSSLFPELKNIVLELLKEKELNYIVFSHVEADESGACNEWLELFPQAQVVCNKIAHISLDNSLVRPALVIKDKETIKLGDMTLEMIETPHFPHNWDAHMWYEQRTQSLFSSDFCCQGGICEPTTEADISEKIINFYTKGNFTPYGKTTNQTVEKIMSYNIKNIVPMHGSTITGSIVPTVLKNIKEDLITKSL